MTESSLEIAAVNALELLDNVAEIQEKLCKLLVDSTLINTERLGNILRKQLFEASVLLQLTLEIICKFSLFGV